MTKPECVKIQSCIYSCHINHILAEKNAVGSQYWVEDVKKYLGELKLIQLRGDRAGQNPACFPEK